MEKRRRPIRRHNDLPESAYAFLSAIAKGGLRGIGLVRFTVK
jgi:hypothetical protein